MGQNSGVIRRTMACAVMMVSIASLQAAPYVLTAVIQTNTALPGGAVPATVGTAGLSNSGRVVAVGQSATGSAVFTQFGQVVGRGAVIDGLEVDNFFSANINNLDQVAFVGQQGTTWRVLTPDGTLVPAGQAVGSSSVSYYIDLPVAWSDGGKASAYAVLANATAALVSSDGTAIKNGDIVGGVAMTAIGQGSLSPNGQLAFIGGFGGSNGIFRDGSLVAGPGYTVGGRTITNYDFRPAVNDAGTVAFTGLFAGGVGVYTQSRIVAETGSTVDGIPLLAAGAYWVDINSHGQVAYRGDYAGGGAIFVDDVLVADRGFFVDGIEIYDIPEAPFLNDAGQVAFTAILMDGNTAVVLATPSAAVPEPQSGVLALIGLAFVAAGKFRRGR
ncbi:MAG: hypothetical protein JNK87_15550 [Bryobacterales bacterium]|nr:hypothetical protein [Bryobacterales bacterium]